MRQLNKRNNLRKDSAYAFDSAWVIAMALDSAFAKGMKYEDLLINRKFKQVLAIRSGIQNINFAGLTVSIIYRFWIMHFLNKHYAAISFKTQKQKNCFGCRQKLLLSNNIPQFFLKILIHLLVYFIVQGPVGFDGNRERVGTVLIKQNREGKLLCKDNSFLFQKCLEKNFL